MKRLSMLLALCLFLTLLPLSVGAETTGAKGAVLMDLETGTLLFEENAHAKLPPASVTKVMTMLLVMEAIDSGRIGWQDTVTVSEAAAAKGGSQIYLKVGETMSVEDMLKSVAVSSANDCACALAEHIAGSEAAFVEKMNARAQELGMEDTHFVNCTGLDDGPDAASHLTSAYDIAIMSRQLLKYHPDIKKYTTIWMDTVRNGAFGLSNTNKMVRFYPGATGLKTGFTAAAGYCLSASALRDGMELIAVVLGCATSQERFSASKALLDRGFASYALIHPSLETCQVPVVLGSVEAVQAVPGEDTALLIDKGQKGQITTEITLEEELIAPVSNGQRVGTLTIRSGQQILRQVPLVAQQAVPRLTFGQILLKITQQLVMAGK